MNKEWCASHFLQSEVAGFLTPHPGPLPIEGRGSAPVVLEIAVRIAAFVAVESVDDSAQRSRSVTAEDPDVAMRSQITTRAHCDPLSPQWGEGRGEG